METSTCMRHLTAELGVEGELAGVGGWLWVRFQKVSPFEALGIPTTVDHGNSEV